MTGEARFIEDPGRQPAIPESPVAVSGGTGFIGERLVRRLVRSGARVRVLARRRPGRETPAAVFGDDPPSNLEVVWGEISCRTALARLVQDAKLVFHLAGCALPWTRDPTEFERVNVTGTRNLCEALPRTGEARLVHVSTNLVAHPRHDPDAAELTAYQRSKRDGEGVLRDFVTAGGDAVIVRPTRVYGPGRLSQANSVTRVIDLYRRGRFRLRLADGGARGNYVYIEDVIDGLLAAARSGRPGATYILGGENATLEQLLGHVSETTGRRHRVISVPLPLARIVALGAEFIANLGTTPFISREWVRLLAYDWPESCDTAIKELELRMTPLAEGVRATVQWLAAGRPDPDGA